MWVLSVASEYLTIALKITLLFALTYFQMNIMDPLLSMVMTGDPIPSILKVAILKGNEMSETFFISSGL